MTTSRKVSLFALFPLCALFVAIPAQGDSLNYTISFTANNGVGPTPTAGSFEYDSTLETFSNFDVVLNGTTFDMTSEANDPGENDPAIYGDPPCIGGETGAVATFTVMTDCSNAFWNFVTESVGPGAFEFLDYGTIGNNWEIATDPHCANNCVANEGGQFVVTENQIATPEPGTIVLMLAGLGGWVMRKRNARSSPPPKID